MRGTECIGLRIPLHRRDTLVRYPPAPPWRAAPIPSRDFFRRRPSQTTTSVSRASVHAQWVASRVVFWRSSLLHKHELPSTWSSTPHCNKPAAKSENRQVCSRVCSPTKTWQTDRLATCLLTLSNRQQLPQLIRRLPNTKTSSPTVVSVWHLRRKSTCTNQSRLLAYQFLVVRVGGTELSQARCLFCLTTDRSSTATHSARVIRAGQHKEKARTR